MYMVQSKGGAIACMILALCLLGTWPALLALLEQRGRLPQHTYLDYTITNFLVAVLIALTFGEIGNDTADEPNFITQLTQFWRNWPSVLLAMVGGMFLNLGNLASQYAFALMGLSVSQVITSSTAVVVGTTVNYFLDEKINRADILFPGVFCFLIAVCLGSSVHASNAADVELKLKCMHDHDGKFKLLDEEVKDLEMVESATSLLKLEEIRAIKVLGKSTLIGLGIAFFAGVCFSLFSPAFNLATNDQWHVLDKGVAKLTVYSAFFYFSTLCFVLGLLLNIVLLYCPVLGLPKSSLKSYVNDWNGRGFALLAGILCGFGNALQFMGGQAAGYAAADSVQALPLVSTFWGIVIFKEYRGSSRRTCVLLVGMLFMFVVAVALLMSSSGVRT